MTGRENHHLSPAFRCPIIQALYTEYFLPGGGSPGSDLALMSACQHSIIDYGSYCAWGAMLAGGEVVLPQSTAGNSKTAAEFLHWTMLEGF